MGAADLLTRLQQMGLTLSAQGEKIRAEPKGALTDELRALIRDNKLELLQVLGAHQPPRELGKCAACRNLRMSEVKIPGVGGRFVWGCAKGHIEHGHTTPELHRLIAPEPCLRAGDYLLVPSWGPGKLTSSSDTDGDGGER